MNRAMYVVFAVLALLTVVGCSLQKRELNSSDDEGLAKALAHLRENRLFRARSELERILGSPGTPSSDKEGHYCNATLALIRTYRDLGTLEHARLLAQQLLHQRKFTLSSECSAHTHMALADLRCILGERPWPLHLRKALRFLDSSNKSSSIRKARLYMIEGSCYHHHKYHHSGLYFTSQVISSINASDSFQLAFHYAQLALSEQDASSIQDTLEALSISASAIDMLGRPDIALRVWKLVLEGSQESGFNVENTHRGIALSGIGVCTMPHLPSDASTTLCNTTEIILSSRIAIRSIIGPRSNADMTGRISWSNIFRRQIPGAMSKSDRDRTRPRALLEKARHDLEQLEYIHGRSELMRALKTALKTLSSWLADMSETISWDLFDSQLEELLSENERVALKRGYGRILNIPQVRPMNSNKALRQTLNGDSIENEFFANGGFAVVDDILTDEALLALQRHAAEATVWHDPRETYIGAYGLSGLLSDAAMRVASELSKLLPGILCGRRLNHLWAYKFSKEGNLNKSLSKSGINVHADDALVSVNIWVQGGEVIDRGTPDRYGGLVIYPNDSADISDTFNQYNRQPQRIRSILDSKGAKRVRISHRINRGVIFFSSLYHESDAGGAAYGSGMRGRRINYTFLFGRRGEQCWLKSLGVVLLYTGSHDHTYEYNTSLWHTHNI